jgi:hypothetical protein
MKMPIKNPAKNDCSFFHVIDLPGEETTQGWWDFRLTEATYHGNVDLRGKRVLEIGAATGSHSFWMEAQGAEVVPYDLSPKDSWDIMATADQEEHLVDKAMRSLMGALNNGWYYCRNRLGSRLELEFGSIYEIPASLGMFDVVTFGSVLLHTRDPIGALLSAADRATDSVIITDRLPPNLDLSRPLMEFMPVKSAAKDFGGWTWWWITPKTLENLLVLRGFTHFKVTVSPHLFVPLGKHIDLFTLVASR